MSALYPDAVKAQQPNRIVRVAKLQIDSLQLEAYKIALKEEIETSLRVEPGVLSLNAVSEKNNPTRILILEIYANDSAYRAHLETSHFKRYKQATAAMVLSLELVENNPIAIDSKPTY
jgi:quinol monooxygenase YgiN